MDAFYFLNYRLEFVKNFYEVSAQPFAAIKHAIEDGTPPYEHPYAEDGESPFQETWNQANDSLTLLGGACISMIGGALHVYMDTLVKLYGNVETFNKTKSDGGWWNRYQSYFKAAGNIDFRESGCDMAVVEEIVLARNRVQHPGSLTSNIAQYLDSDLKKMRSPLFIREAEAEFIKRLGDGDDSWLLPPTVYVDWERLNTAIEEVKRLGSWLDELP